MRVIGTIRVASNFAIGEGVPITTDPEKMNVKIGLGSARRLNPKEIELTVVLDVEPEVSFGPTGLFVTLIDPDRF